MYSELKKLYKNLCNNKYDFEGIDIGLLMEELKGLENDSGYVPLKESLSLGGNVCKTCGRPF